MTQIYDVHNYCKVELEAYHVFILSHYFLLEYWQPYKFDIIKKMRFKLITCYNEKVLIKYMYNVPI